MENHRNENESQRAQPSEQRSTLFVYAFSVWPDETWDFNKAMFDLFRLLNSRVEITFPEEDFELFRSRLSHHGLTLREIERVPYFEPEPVP